MVSASFDFDLSRAPQVSSIPKRGNIANELETINYYGVHAVTATSGGCRELSP